jgi:hypothetical protein
MWMWRLCPGGLPRRRFPRRHAFSVSRSLEPQDLEGQRPDFRFERNDPSLDGFRVETISPSPSPSPSSLSHAVSRA